jgi:osmoprotectant transport system permease protein
VLAAACLSLLTIAQRVKVSSGFRAAFGLGLVLVFGLMVKLGSFDNLSIAREFASHAHDFGSEFLRHVFLVGAAMAFSIAFSIPLTWAVLNYRTPRQAIFSSLSILQTIPSRCLVF